MHIVNPLFQKKRRFFVIDLAFRRSTACGGVIHQDIRQLEI